MAMNVRQEHFVAYIDVLGFSDLVKNSEPELVFNYLSGLVDLVHDLNKRENFQCCIDIGSDTIVLSVPIDDVPDDSTGKLMKFIKYINRLQLRNIVELECLPLRGGITAGQFYTNGKNVLFGKAYIEAHDLEKAANFPRILVDPNHMHPGKISDILGTFNVILAHIGLSPQYLDLRSLDIRIEDERQHCNYLSCLVPAAVLDEQWDYEKIDILMRHKNFIKKKLSEGEAMAKYEWIKDYHNWFCSGYSELANYSI